ncbi:maleylpyruvate isomerase N-terminal domain-containing protein [Actinocorallia populi]|uniref:maleylpyruvate isomerase N-terminal domain-containing protein n=1 Tax=Actinocorallia populi TaxID=2079200 RepID=UPI0013009B8B|nr:maleylpyruvate isomerase N-terminal domain-containing protein [Actinocorallia populi]
MPSDAPDRYDALLADQWYAIRAWAASPPVVQRIQAPSVLEGWTVRDLLAHLGRSFTAVEAARPAPEAELRTVLEYVTGYAEAAGEIAQGTRELAATLDREFFSGLDELARRGLTALSRLPDPVVRGPRGVLRRADFVTTRLLELVVHGDDLTRSLPDLEPVPLLPEAVELVAATLAAAYRERTGNPSPTRDAITWIRAAAGRVPDPDPALPLF